MTARAVKRAAFAPHTANYNNGKKAETAFTARTLIPRTPTRNEPRSSCASHSGRTHLLRKATQRASVRAPTWRDSGPAQLAHRHRTRGQAPLKRRHSQPTVPLRRQLDDCAAAIPFLSFFQEDGSADRSTPSAGGTRSRSCCLRTHSQTAKKKQQAGTAAKRSGRVPKAAEEELHAFAPDGDGVQTGHGLGGHSDSNSYRLPRLQVEGVQLRVSTFRRPASV